MVWHQGLSIASIQRSSAQDMKSLSDSALASVEITRGTIPLGPCQICEELQVQNPLMLDCMMPACSQAQNTSAVSFRQVALLATMDLPTANNI
eukprot:scaffold85828_cov29-Prasinocladus_malaysianus.AAC.1